MPILMNVGLTEEDTIVYQNTIENDVIHNHNNKRNQIDNWKMK